MSIVEGTRELEPREAPIGWDGRTLREMLRESERLFRETGHYHGIEELELRGADPIRYEKIFSRVRGGLVSARETAMNISASPIVKELGELCFALYTPEGDSIALSTGIIVHVHTMSDAIKWMIRQGYEEDPGIRPGDIFSNNDAMVGDVHNADVQTFLPIFWDGELIAWAGAVNHVIDIGASTPGSGPVGPTSRFEDGIDLSARKVGSHGRLWRDHVLAGLKATRQPMYWMLDERTRLTGATLIREAVERVLLEEGVDTYKQFVREVIEDGRRSFKSRLRQMTVPGRYRAPSFAGLPFSQEERLPSYARHDTLMHAPVEFRITRDARLEVDYEGASSWGYHSFNSTPSGIQGALWVLMTQTLVCNDKINDGAYLALDVNVPPGTWANHCNPSCSTGLAWWFLIPSFMGFAKSLGRALQARGFVEEVLAPFAMSSNGVQGGGIDQYGRQSGMANFGFSCVGGGAKMVLDGLDHAAAVWNPEGDMGDVEMWELPAPLVYLGQRVKASTGGPGRHRGGSGYESLLMMWKTPMYEMQNIDPGGQVFMQSGLWGGYPGASNYRHNVRGTDLLERFATGRPFPTHDGDPENSEMLAHCEGEHEFDQTVMTLPKEMHSGDLYLSVYRGAAGLGDPLERRPQDIVDDLEGGHLLPRLAASVYGAVVAQDEQGRWSIDEAATAQRRAELREQRRRRAVPVSEWLGRERETVLARDMEPVVQRMYAESMRLSEAWAAEFRAFWDLPDDFVFPVPTPEVDLTMSLRAQPSFDVLLHDGAGAGEEA